MSTILIIDDSPEDRDQFAFFLEDAEPGLVIIAKRGGKDGLAVVSQQVVDCVLLDLRLDGEDGMAVLEELKQFRPNLPVIVLTGDGSERAATDAFVAGAAFYLPKHELTAETLWTAVSRVIQQAATLRELKSKQDALERSNRLDAVGQLAAGIAHDFNNQLGALRYCIELLKDAAVTDKFKEQIRTALKIIDDSADLATRMVSLSRQGDLLAVNVPLREVFADVQAVASASVANQVTLDVGIPRNDLTAFCDPSQLLNAILNLIINANDAIVAKHMIGTISIGAVEDGAKVRVIVKDNGIGMSQDLIARSTDPFFTTKDGTNGTGLGLAIVQAFVKENNGDLFIHSNEGVGTEVTLELPAGKDVSEPIEKNTLPIAVLSETASILIVEDKFPLAMMTKEILEKEGFSAEVVGDAESALELLSSGFSVDVLLTDIKLPGINGFRLASLVRNQNPKMGVIYVTGYADNPEHDQEERLGPILQKPFEPKELAATIAKVLEREKA